MACGWNSRWDVQIVVIFTKNLQCNSHVNDCMGVNGENGAPKEPARPYMALLGSETIVDWSRTLLYIVCKTNLSPLNSYEIVPQNQQLNIQW